MRPVICLLFLSFWLAAKTTPIITTTENSITLTCKTPTLTEESSIHYLFGEKCVTLTGESVLLQQLPGKPELPYFSHTLILPYGKSVDTILFKGEYNKEVTLSGPLTYALNQFPTHKPLGETTIDTLAYKKRSQTAGAQLISLQKQHGVQLLTLASYPVQYNPQNTRVNISEEYEITVLLKNDATSRDAHPLPQRVSLEQRTLNKTALSSYPQKGERDSEQYDWLAISDIFNTTSQAMNTLVKHREEQGLKCKVVDVATIGTTAQEIRTFIRNEYLNHGIKYVLLAGDETTIPPFRVNVYQGILIMMDTITTDLPYQCLDDEDWEEKYYDEPVRGDFTAEVNIGRILCSSMFDFIHQTEKILTYEQLDSSDKALSTFLGLGEKLDEDDWGKTFIENTHAIIPHSITKELLCEKDEMWYADDLVDTINSNKFTIVNHKGHAEPGSIMKLRDATAMSNEIPLFVKSIGCKPAAFHISPKTITERLTLGQYGFFAATLNTHYGWYSGNGKGSSQTVTELFWKGHFEEGIRTFGGMTEYSHRACMNYSSWELIYLWDMISSNYFGDPATPCRTPGGAEAVTENNVGGKQPKIISTTITGTTLTIHSDENVSLKLCNVMGREIHRLDLEAKADVHTVNLKNMPCASGVYLAQLKAGSITKNMRLLLP